VRRDWGLCPSGSRVQLNAAGQVELTLKTPWRDGTTHLVMSPLQFMRRLAALLPRPRLNLIRFYGVLTPNAKQRALVVPPAPPAQASTSVLSRKARSKTSMRELEAENARLKACMPTWRYLTQLGSLWPVAING
jgi:Putative transposase